MGAVDTPELCEGCVCKGEENPAPAAEVHDCAFDVRDKIKPGHRVRCTCCKKCTKECGEG